MDDSSDSATYQHRNQRTPQADGHRRIELIIGSARRRRWTTVEKSALVAESARPGVNVSALADEAIAVLDRIARERG